MMIMTVYHHAVERDAAIRQEADITNSQAHNFLANRLQTSCRKADTPQQQIRCNGA